MSNPSMTTTRDAVIDRESRHVLQVYRRTPVVFVRGQGVRYVDIDGRSYLDLLSGIGVASMGHAHPVLGDEIADQARTLVHTSNLYFHTLQGDVAERLTALSGLDRVFFCNSGTEAVEAALKFARRYWSSRGETRRTGFVALERGFHGRTFGALSVTAEPHYREPFGPLVPGVSWVPANDVGALDAAVSDQTAAVIVEPIQGEGGVRPLTPAFATRLNDVASRTGTLLIADEIQSGLGRTGEAFFAHTIGLRPDLVTVGKALGGGVAVGATLVAERIASTIAMGDHGTTYGGNLLACRAARVFLEHLTAPGGLQDNVREVAPVIEAGLQGLARRHPLVTEVRGRGLIWGLELAAEAAPVVSAALARGLVVGATARTVIRLLPPLVITPDEIREGLALLDEALGDVERAESSGHAGGDVLAGR